MHASTAYRAGGALLAALVALLWLAPLLDHHVAERVPHVHLLPHDDAAPHRHAYELPHHGDAADPTVPEATTAAPVVKPLQGSYLALALLALALWLPALRLPAGGHTCRPCPSPDPSMGVPLLPARLERPPPA